jgi:Ca2+-binding RTX toxin-like protein
MRIRGCGPEERGERTIVRPFLDIQPIAVAARRRDALAAKMDIIGTPNNDTLTGTPGDDHIEGAGGADTLNGEDGNDELLGGTGNDIINGGAGNDRLDGGTGADTMTGGAGDDLYFVDDKADVVIEAAGGGVDEVRVSLTSYILPANVEKGTATATTNTVLTGNGLDNVLTGTPGWDTIDGGAGADTMIGGAGNDWYIVDNAGDVIVESTSASGGSDTVETSLASYTLQAGVELVNGNSSHQVLTGNDGDNWLTSNGGSDTLIGGKGNDLYQMTAGDTLVELPGEGIDLVRTTLTYYVLPDNFEELQGTSFVSAQTLIGNAADNRIIGTLLNNQSDTIDGGLGADLMIGYHGSDVYYVDNVGDTIVEESNHGTADEVRTVIDFTAPTNVELLSAWNDNGLRLTGNGLANTIRGRGGNDILDGAGGVDQLIGGLGNDLYRIDSSDTIVEAAGGGVDTVEAGFSYTLGAEVENLTLTGTAAVNGTGNGLDNVLIGNSADNLLRGGAGNDVISGGGGTDTAVYSGNGFDYQIDTSNPNAITVRDMNAADGDDGTDTLSGIRYIQFANGRADMGVDPNNAPQLGLPAMEDQIWEDSESAFYTIPGTAFFDLDANDTLSFQATLAGGSPLPGWLSFNASTRTFSGTPPLDQIGVTIEIVVTASDGKKSISDNVLFTVTQAPGAIVQGTDGNDVLEGTFRNEQMVGLDGDDVLRGSGGADSLNGGAGLDEVDYSSSATGVTVDLPAGTGLGGDAEGDELFSIESVTGSAHDDHIVGGPGLDILSGGAGADLLEGGSGSDLLIGGEGADSLFGGEGQDILRVRANADGSLEDVVVDGGLHIDTLDLAESPFGAMVDLTNPSNGVSSIEIVIGSALNDTITGGAGGETIYGGGGIDTLSGGGATDYIYGEAGNDILNGGSGSDLLEGGEGDDYMDGGADADTLYDGAGNDIFVITEGDTIAFQAVNDGTDEVRADMAAYTLGFNLENLTGISSLGQALTGNELTNIIRGGIGNDILDGAGGSDSLFGGLGNDVYVIDAGDTFAEGEEQGIDEVRTGLASFSLANIANVENLTGVNLNQTLTGNGWNNVIDGGGGEDIMAGGGGHDVYIVDNINDTVIELDGAGIDEVRTSLGSKAAPDYFLYVLPNYVENLTGTSAGAQGVRGNSLDNVIVMAGGADLIVLDDGGADNINAGGGNDYIYYGATLTAADVTNGGAGTDTIGLLGNYAGLVFGASSLVGVERLALYTGGGTNSYNVTMNDANVAAGTEFFVTAASLNTSEILTFNGAAETNGRFTVLGGSGADTIVGGAGNDYVAGNGGNDTLYGLGGSDTLFGGAGADQLRGGAGQDFFRYQATTDSMTGSVDQILDFTGIDRIDLSAIDAIGGGGNDAFTFIGASAFHNVAGELRAYQSGPSWFVEGDVNGDGVADLLIQLTVTDANPIVAGNFIL